MARIVVEVEDDRAEDLKKYISKHIGVKSVDLEMGEEPEETKAPMMERPEEEEEETEEEERTAPEEESQREEFTCDECGATLVGEKNYKEHLETHKEPEEETE